MENMGVHIAALDLPRSHVVGGISTLSTTHLEIRQKSMHPFILNGRLATSLMFLVSGFATGANSRSGAFLPSIAVNPDRTTAFTSVANGRLAAINLSDGSIGWQSQRPLEALGFAGDFVVASAPIANCANCLQIVWVSPYDGLEQRTSDTISFPTWVSVEAAIGRQFKVTVEMQGASLALNWEASSRYVGGAYPTSRILADFNKDVAGTFLIDAQGHASVVATQPIAASVIPEALRAVKTTTWWNCSEWRDTPVIDSDGMVAFDVAVDARGQTLSARRWRLPSGELDATRVLMHGSNLELQTSPDARYLFLHDGVVDSDVAGTARSWGVFSMRTLRPVANVPYPAKQACANVAADAVVMLIEKSMPTNQGGSRSRDLVTYASSNGKLLWSVKLRDGLKDAHPR